MTSSWQPGTPVELTTERLLIRSLRVEDAGPRFRGWFDDEEVFRHVAVPEAFGTSGGLIAAIRMANNRTLFFLGLFLRSTGEPIGFTKLVYHPEHNRTAATVVIAEKSHWGKRLAWELESVHEFIFSTLGARKHMVFVYSDNEKVLRALDAKPFWKREAYLREHERGKDGEFRDVVAFALMKEDWEAWVRDAAGALTSDA